MSHISGNELLYTVTQNDRIHHYKSRNASVNKVELLRLRVKMNKK